MSELTLSAEWQAWVSDSLLSERPVDWIVGVLVHEGLDRERALAEVEALRVAPATTAARQALRRRRPAELAARLHRATRSLGRPELDRRRDVSASTLRDVYIAHSVPVVLPGWCADWPAASWSPESLRARFGEVEVQVSRGRSADPAPDRNWEKHTETMAFGAYVDAVQSVEGNDVYMIANHRNLDGPLRGLLDDLTPPGDAVVTDNLVRNASFWFGPSGTITPTHHDTTNILFCQLYGRKRFWLAPPDEERLAWKADGFYSSIALSDDRVMLEGGALSGGQVYEVTLEPGDTLLIPVGWWHEVRSLEVSISVSVVGLRIPNRFDWYTPGQQRSGGPAGPHA